MADDFTTGEFTYPSVEEALERIQSIMLSRVENKLGVDEEREYKALTRSLMSNEGVRNHLPRLITVNSDLGGVWAMLRDVSDKWEPRRQFIREQMQGSLDAARSNALEVPSSTWTGIRSDREKLAAARKFLPLAQATVEGLITELERPQGNGGPPLEDRAEAIDNLRQLHRAIGELLTKLEAEASRPVNQRLLDEAAGYLSRAAQALRDDPMPYLVSAGLFTIFSTLGGGAVGGYLAGIASRIKKNSEAGGRAFEERNSNS